MLLGQLVNDPAVQVLEICNPVTKSLTVKANPKISVYYFDFDTAILRDRPSDKFVIRRDNI